MFSYALLRYRLNVFEGLLRQILSTVQALMAKASDIAASEAALKTSVDALLDRFTGTSAALADISAKLDAANQALASAGVDTAALDAVKTDIDAEKDKVDAAVTAAGGPATPAPPVAAPDAPSP